MNRTAKIILGIVAGILILCLLCGVTGILMFRASGRTLERSFQTNPANAETIADGIAEYDLPVGFGDEFGMQVADFAMVGYTGEDDHRHIFLFQLPSYVTLDEDQIQDRLQQAYDRNDRPERLQVVDRLPGKIRGQEVELVVSEGINHDNQAYREVSAIFQGRGGQAVVLISGPVTNWDQRMVDEFIASFQ